MHWQREKKIIHIRSWITAVSDSQEPSQSQPLPIYGPSFLSHFTFHHLFIIPISFPPVPLRLNTAGHQWESVYTQTVGVISVAPVSADRHKDRHSLASLLRSFFQRAALKRNMFLSSVKKSELWGRRQAGASLYLPRPRITLIFFSLF